MDVVVSRTKYRWCVVRVTWNTSVGYREKSDNGQGMNKRFIRPRVWGVRNLSVVHAHGDAGPLEVEDVEVQCGAAILRLELHGQLAGTRHHEVRRLVLVAIRVSANKFSCIHS